MWYINSFFFIIINAVLINGFYFFSANRFSLDIDFDAPKVSIPLKGTVLSNDEDFFLDFGHFTLHTRVSFNVIASSKSEILFSDLIS